MTFHLYVNHGALCAPSRRRLDPIGYSMASASQLKVPELKKQVCGPTFALRDPIEARTLTAPRSGPIEA